MTSRDGSCGYVKTDFDFGWKRWKSVPELARKVLEHQKGDVLDIGCATCQLSTFLRDNGWKGRYTGVDVKRYEGYAYPEGVELLVGDALDLELPQADTVVLYDILEHTRDPVGLLSKAVRVSRHNVLVSVPLRNEEMWALGVVEPHQLDRTHMHCGFTEVELRNIVSASGGQVVRLEYLGRVSATIGVNLWRGWFAKKMAYAMDRIFSSREYHCGIWCEVVRSSR